MAHDMDLDVDYGLEEEQGYEDRNAPVNAISAMTEQSIQQLIQSNKMNNSLDDIIAEGSHANRADSDDDQADEGEINEDDIQPNKVHLRFTNHHLTTRDIRTWATSNCDIQPVRIEWVDDTSSNILYESQDEAYEALLRLASEDVTDEKHETRAKRYDVQPDTQFYVRTATMRDVKAPQAAAASKHYLDHPENDPAERSRGRYSYRGSITRGNFRSGDRRGPIDADLDRGEMPFSVDMYDDTTEVSRGPWRAPEPKGMARELLPAKKSGGGLRSRSASPARDNHRRYSRSRSPSSRRGGYDNPSRFRSRSPARRFSHRESFSASSNATKELLFRSPAPSTSRRVSRPGHDGRDLIDLAPSSAKLSQGRLDGSDTSPGFVIKGSATGSRDFAIKGAASAAPGGGERDLFPAKLGGGGGGGGGDLLAGSPLGYGVGGAGDHYNDDDDDDEAGFAAGYEAARRDLGFGGGLDGGVGTPVREMRRGSEQDFRRPSLSRSVSRAPAPDCSSGAEAPAWDPKLGFCVMGSAARAERREGGYH
ncbi:hypothetical protein MBLNU230_g8178t1 [Neophaeotheca triangularis]